MRTVTIMYIQSNSLITWAVVITIAIFIFQVYFLYRKRSASFSTKKIEVI